MSSSNGVRSSHWNSPGRTNEVAGPLHQIHNFASPPVPSSKQPIASHLQYTGETNGNIQDRDQNSATIAMKVDRLSRKDVPPHLRHFNLPPGCVLQQTADPGERDLSLADPLSARLHRTPISQNVQACSTSIGTTDSKAHPQGVIYTTPPQLHSASATVNRQKELGMPVSHSHRNAPSTGRPSPSHFHDTLMPSCAQQNSKFQATASTRDQLQQLPAWGTQSTSASIADVQKKHAPSSVQLDSSARPEGVDFLSWMNQNIGAKNKAKLNALAEKEIKLANVSADRATRYKNFALPNSENDIAFKTRIADQIKAPPLNGKRYTFTGTQRSQPTPQVTSLEAARTDLVEASKAPQKALAKSKEPTQVPIAPKPTPTPSTRRPIPQTLKSGRDLGGSLLRYEIDPHSAFGPEEKVRTGPTLRFGDIDNDLDPEASSVRPARAITFVPAATPGVLDNEVEAVALIQNTVVTRDDAHQPTLYAPAISTVSSWSVAPAMSEEATEALVAPGFEPATSSYDVEDKVSDSGVKITPKENVRATQGRDARLDLLDWDGISWQPAPTDWEHDREAFDSSFMHSYISQDWAPTVPSGPKVTVNTRAPEFETAVPVEAGGHFTPFEHPLTAPDTTNSDNPDRQRFLTSATAMRRYVKNNGNRVRVEGAGIQAQNFWPSDSQLQIQARPEEIHPYKPKIDMYLRPATTIDAKGIADIYNYYVLNSLATEDQTVVAVEKIAFLINFTHEEKFPFIVAVKGKMPLPCQVNSYQAKKSMVPQFETIIGFAYAETYCYGLGGGRDGRSRFTAFLHFYVHPLHTKLRVGQSLLDRAIQSLSHSYGAKDGYEWMNPKSDPIYEYGGIRKVHQLIIQYTLKRKDDITFEWMRSFLRRYYFDEEGRIPSIARTHAASGPGPAKFCDNVFFVKELSASSNFGGMI